MTNKTELRTSTRYRLEFFSAIIRLAVSVDIIEKTNKKQQQGTGARSGEKEGRKPRARKEKKSERKKGKTKVVRANEKV